MLSTLKSQDDSNKTLYLTSPSVRTQHYITYAGTHLTRSIRELYATNFLPLLAKIKQDLQRWSSGSFSWFGSIGTLKMNILPRLLYLLQTLSISVLRIFLKQTHSKFSNFLWAQKYHRISHALMTQPKERGELGFHDP